MQLFGKARRERFGFAGVQILFDRPMLRLHEAKCITAVKQRRKAVRTVCFVLENAKIVQMTILVADQEIKQQHGIQIVSRSQSG